MKENDQTVPASEQTTEPQQPKKVAKSSRQMRRKIARMLVKRMHKELGTKKIKFKEYK